MPKTKAVRKTAAGERHCSRNRRDGEGEQQQVGRMSIVSRFRLTFNKKSAKSFRAIWPSSQPPLVPAKTLFMPSDQPPSPTTLKTGLWSAVAPVTLGRHSICQPSQPPQYQLRVLDDMFPPFLGNTARKTPANRYLVFLNTAY